jgi:ProP effector
MTKTARRARTAAVIKSLCERFPQTFSRNGPRPLKVGVYADALAALGDAVQPRDLQSALRAYTSNARYLRALSAGACRVGLDGKPAGTVTPEDEAVARARLAEVAKAMAAARAKVPLAKAPEPAARTTATENPKPPAPKRLSLADLREAGRRRREAAA